MWPCALENCSSSEAPELSVLPGNLHCVFVISSVTVDLINWTVCQCSGLLVPISSRWITVTGQRPVCLSNPLLWLIKVELNEPHPPLPNTLSLISSELFLWSTPLWVDRLYGSLNRWDLLSWACTKDTVASCWPPPLSGMLLSLLCIRNLLLSLVLMKHCPHDISHLLLVHVFWDMLLQCHDLSPSHI